VEEVENPQLGLALSVGADLQQQSAIGPLAQVEIRLLAEAAQVVACHEIHKGLPAQHLRQLLQERQALVQGVELRLQLLPLLQLAEELFKLLLRCSEPTVQLLPALLKLLDAFLEALVLFGLVRMGIGFELGDSLLQALIGTLEGFQLLRFPLQVGHHREELLQGFHGDAHLRAALLQLGVHLGTACLLLLASALGFAELAAKLFAVAHKLGVLRLPLPVLLLQLRKLTLELLGCGAGVLRHRLQTALGKLLAELLQYGVAPVEVLPELVALLLQLLETLPELASILLKLLGLAFQLRELLTQCIAPGAQLGGGLRRVGHAPGVLVELLGDRLEAQGKLVAALLQHLQLRTQPFDRFRELLQALLAFELLLFELPHLLGKFGAWGKG